MIEVSMEKRRSERAFLGPARRNALASWEDYGELKNSLFEICRYLRHIMALRFRDLGVRSSSVAGGGFNRFAHSAGRSC